MNFLDDFFKKEDANIVHNLNIEHTIYLLTKLDFQTQSEKSAPTATQNIEYLEFTLVYHLASKHKNLTMNIKMILNSIKLNFKIIAQVGMQV